MAIELSFEFRNKTYKAASAGLKALQAAIAKDWDGSAKVLSRELKAFLTEVATALASRHGGAWPGGTTASTLSKRSGTLIESITKSISVTGSTIDTVRGTIGSDTPYAAIQEFGGTIKAKNGKYLCIPLPAALDSSGLPLKSSPRDWPNTFVAKSKAGNLLIFQKVGHGIRPLYVLKTEVTVPPRLGLKTTLQAGIPYFVARAMDAMVKDLKGA